MTQKREPTEQEYKEYHKKVLAKFKEDPQYELKRELGMLLMIHIDDFTPEQRKRYDELLILIK